MALEGDENTRFFHACATQRNRRNKIQVIEHHDCEIHNHDQKAAVLRSFYLDLLGHANTTTWAFQLADLYPEGPLSLSHLDAPFDHSEIARAFHHMHSTASPGPDGFGPLFYKANWNTISSYIYNFLIFSTPTQLKLSGSIVLTLCCFPRRTLLGSHRILGPLLFKTQLSKGSPRFSLTGYSLPSLHSLLMTSLGSCLGDALQTTLPTLPIYYTAVTEGIHPRL